MENPKSKLTLKPVLVYYDDWMEIQSLKVTKGYKKSADVIDFLLKERKTV